MAGRVEGLPFDFAQGQCAKCEDSIVGAFRNASPSMTPSVPREACRSATGLGTEDEPMRQNGTRKVAEIMTLRDVARYLGLHVMTVYKLTREGRVPAAKIGGQWRFKRDVLDQWLETQMHRHTP